MIFVRRLYLKQGKLNMQIRQVKSYRKNSLIAMMVRIPILSSHIQSHVQPTGLSVIENSKVISIEDAKLDTYSVTIYALADERNL